MLGQAPGSDATAPPDVRAGGNSTPELMDALAIHLHWPGNPPGPKCGGDQQVSLRHLMLAFALAPEMRAHILARHQHAIRRETALMAHHIRASSLHRDRRVDLVRQLGEARVLG